MWVVKERAREKRDLFQFKLILTYCSLPDGLRHTSGPYCRLWERCQQSKTKHLVLSFIPFIISLSLLPRLSLIFCLSQRMTLELQYFIVCLQITTFVLLLLFVDVLHSLSSAFNLISILFSLKPTRRMVFQRCLMRMHSIDRLTTQQN